nr:hypothetical protein [Pseudomonas typographi]
MSDLHGWLLGRLSWDALPFYSAIATVAAGVLVAGVLAAYW